VDWSDVEEKLGGPDEHDALREYLVRAMRRQPGDTRALMRLAVSLSRMGAAERRMSRGKQKGLFARYAAMLAGFEHQLAVRPPEEGKYPPPGDDSVSSEQ
jgi:hypothetical protein